MVVEHNMSFLSNVIVSFQAAGWNKDAQSLFVCHQFGEAGDSSLCNVMTAASAKRQVAKRRKDCETSTTPKRETRRARLDMK